ncbi:MAG TPA: amidohydrolase [Candidatus Limnocylindria bacterium]|nr:amidohydrolase [Candidatus Limnocylindria bacterium]
MGDERADLVVVGASLEAIAGRTGPADWLAVRDGRIVAIGSRADVRSHVGPRTEVLELHGETVLPGFQDAHVHPISAGLLADRCDLHDLTDASAYVDAVRRYASAHPDREWILGGGWSLTAFPRGEPPRELLDEAVGDRPALLESNDGHVAWASSRALSAAGIGPGTPDPPDGRIARDEAGAPAGALIDGAALLVEPHVPEPSHAELLAGLRTAQAQLHAWGVTAWQDAHGDAATLAAYRDAASTGWLTARVTAAQWWERGEGMEQLERFEDERARSSIGPLKADNVKLMLDGILESRTAYMVDPYAGTDERGVPFIEPGLLRQAVAELDRCGFAAHFHAIGDGAVRLALDAVEEARRRNGPSGGRHHASHLEVVHPEDVARFAALDVTANIQPFWAADDDQMRQLRIPAVGPGRVKWQYVFRSLRDAGARLAGGSDWPVTTGNPLLEMEVAVRRVAPDARDTPPFVPEERLTLEDALAAFTIGSAYVNGLDAETGTLEAGKRADLVVMDRDLRSPEAAYLGEARVMATYVDGREVYRA